MFVDSLQAGAIITEHFLKTTAGVTMLVIISKSRKFAMTVMLFRLFIFAVFCFLKSAGRSSTTLLANTMQQTTCGDWVPYGDEKCLHIVDSAVFQTKHEADVVCQSLAEVLEVDDIPRLVTVGDEREQKVLERILFEEIGLLEPVWLGLDREDDGVFRWNSGAEIYFDNLAKQNVSDADRPCVQMESGQGIYPMGQWVRVNCRKRNVVVCEKIQIWPPAKLQTNFLNLKLQIDRQLRSQNNFLGRGSQSVATSSEASVDKTPCGDWPVYKNEKCIMLLDDIGTQTKEDANFACESLGEAMASSQKPKLIIIKTGEKQNFLQRLLFEKQGIVDNVWLGLEMDDKSSFRWNDMTELNFTNWATQANEDSDRKCVQMASGEGMAPVGQWVKTNCKKRSAVVCEKPQTVTLTTLENKLQSLKLEVNAVKQEAERRINTFKKEAELQMNEAYQKLNNIVTSLVPMGFIYMQLPGRDSPTTLWPHFTWEDISSDYSGLFFRVVGGEAAPFGQLQNQSARDVANIYFGVNINSKTEPIIADRSWSLYAYKKSSTDRTKFDIRHQHIGNEVRPRNKSVKLWQRIK